MLTLSPTARFVIGVFITLAIGISSGAVVLTHAIPDAWIPIVTAWAGIFAFIGSAVQTGLQGIGMTTTNKIANAAADPNVKQIITTSEIANSPTFQPVDKVTSVPPPAH